MTKIRFPGKPFRLCDVVPLAGFAVCAFAFYPGIMTPDTLDQLNQANSHTFNDWHPPMMAWLWSGLNLVFPSASGFLFLDLFLLWFGLFSIERSIDHRFSPFVYLLGVMPFVINLSGIVWKDVATAYVLMCAVLFLLRPKTYLNLAGFSLCIFIGIGIRYNSLFSCIPLIIGYFWLWFADRKPALSRVRVLGISVCFFAAQLVCLNLFNYQWLHTTRTTPQIVIMVDDLSYISTQVGKSLVPEIDLDTVTRSTQVSMNDNVFRFNKFLDYAAVKESWKQAVRQYPFVYLKFRARVFLRFLGLSLAPPFDLDVPSREFWLESSYQSQETNEVRREIGEYVRYSAIQWPFLFTGIFWLCMATAVFCLGLAKTSHYRVATLALSSSAILNLGSYVLVANAPYFRYYYWSVVATTLAVFLTVFTSDRQTRR